MSDWEDRVALIVDDSLPLEHLREWQRRVLLVLGEPIPKSLALPTDRGAGDFRLTTARYVKPGTYIGYVTPPKFLKVLS